jgi:hypothetical protein
MFNGRYGFVKWLLLWVVVLAIALSFPRVRESLRSEYCGFIRGPHFNPAFLQKVCHDQPLRK